MTPFFQSLPVIDEEKFLPGITSSTPGSPPHYHHDLEIVLVKEGRGNYFIGNHVGVYRPGDIFLIGTNVPHAFEGLSETGTKAISVQFKADFLGRDFIDLPETSQIKTLFNRAKSGLKLSKSIYPDMLRLVQDFKSQTGFNRIISLCTCLNMMASDDGSQMLSTADLNNYYSRNRNTIERIFQYTHDNFDRVITLEEIAAVANMSIPTFCDYFKRTVQKTYIEFLNQFRISFACKLLVESEMSVREIYLKCGFNTPANFNKQFLKYKRMSPSRYKKEFEAVSKQKSNMNYAA